MVIPSMSTVYLEPAHPLCFIPTFPLPLQFGKQDPLRKAQAESPCSTQCAVTWNRTQPSPHWDHQCANVHPMSSHQMLLMPEFLCLPPTSPKSCML